MIETLDGRRQNDLVEPGGEVMDSIAGGQLRHGSVHPHFLFELADAFL